MSYEILIEVESSKKLLAEKLFTKPDEFTPKKLREWIRDVDGELYIRTFETQLIYSNNELRELKTGKLVNF